MRCCLFAQGSFWARDVELCFDMGVSNFDCFCISSHRLATWDTVSRGFQGRSERECLVDPFCFSGRGHVQLPLEPVELVGCPLRWLRTTSCCSQADHAAPRIGTSWMADRVTQPPWQRKHWIRPSISLPYNSYLRNGFDETHGSSDN